MKIFLRPGAQMRTFFFPCTCRLVNGHLSLVTVCALLVSAGNIFAQGDLTPPGAPAPTMKSLDQIEARTPIAGGTSTVTISQHGSYYLTGDIAVTTGNGIVISADNVTLDLNGFRVSSSAASPNGTGVFLVGPPAGEFNLGAHDISILNGHIVGGVTYNGTSFSTGPGFQNGIAATGNPGSVRVSGVSVMGCSGSGINLGSEFSTVVDHCAVRVVGGVGILAGVVSDSTAYQCGDNGIAAATVTGCYGTTTAGARGIYTLTAVNCWGVSVSGAGVDATSASDCYGQSTSGRGLNVQMASNCYGISSSTHGINASTANNCYGISTSSLGISASMANNCYGISSSSYGVAALVAAFCNGSGGSGGITTTIAIGCYSFGGTQASYRYLMP